MESAYFMEHAMRNRFAILSDLLLGLPIYLTSIGGWNNQDKMIRKQGYAYFHKPRSYLLLAKSFLKKAQ
jgi:hypothetical protein